MLRGTKHWYFHRVRNGVTAAVFSHSTVGRPRRPSFSLLLTSVWLYSSHWNASPSLTFPGASSGSCGYMYPINKPIE